MFTDEDRKRALEALAANGGRVTKTLRELGLPLDRFGHESFIPTAQLVGNEVEYMLDDQRAAPVYLTISSRHHSMISFYLAWMVHSRFIASSGYIVFRTLTFALIRFS